MSEKYFSTLLDHGKKLDEGIKKLTETWRRPASIIGGYGASVEDAEACLRILDTKITTLKQDMASWEDLTIRIDETDKFLRESQWAVDDLVQSCRDIETVLSDYGYAKPTKDKISEMESSGDSSPISSDVTEDHLEVEFTPDLTWRRKAKANLS